MDVGVFMAQAVPLNKGRGCTSLQPDQEVLLTDTELASGTPNTKVHSLAHIPSEYSQPYHE